MTNVPKPAIEQRYLDTRRAFDSVAGQYRGPLGNNRLVQGMREALWRTVREVTPDRGQLLDLGCGTGLDAVYFAGQGYTVTAIDWSPEMITQTLQLVEKERIGDRLSAMHLGIQELDRLAGQAFDCIYSDLGALNCVDDLGTTARHCAALVKGGGTLVFSVIGRLCPWELAYYSLRGNLKRARVRFANGPVPVNLNGCTVWTRYYTPRQFYREFAEHFAWRACRALNLFLPPPYLIGPYERHPTVFKPLRWLDHVLGSLPAFNRAGDHFLIVMSRRE